MKKAITLALALLMVCSMSVTAFAATTTLTTTIPEATYTLNIPANQEIPYGTTEMKIGNVTVTESAGFADGKNLNVTITYEAFSATGISTKIPYTLSLYAAGTAQTNTAIEELSSGTTISFIGKKDGTVATNTTIKAKSPSASNPVPADVTDIMFSALSEDWGKALAGEYTTTITFTSEVVAE